MKHSSVACVPICSGDGFAMARTQRLSVRIDSEGYAQVHVEPRLTWLDGCRRVKSQRHRRDGNWQRHGYTFLDANRLAEIDMGESCKLRGFCIGVLPRFIARL